MSGLWNVNAITTDGLEAIIDSGSFMPGWLWIRGKGLKLDVGVAF